jgi:hypothetical protein
MTTERSRTPAEHLAAALRTKADDPSALALLSSLSSAGCLPLDSQGEQAARDADEQKRKQQMEQKATEQDTANSSSSSGIHPLSTSAAAAAAALTAAAATVTGDSPPPFAAPSAVAALDSSDNAPPPRPCEFSSADVTLLDLSSVPPRIVSAIPAKGLRWKPIGQRRVRIRKDDSSNSRGGSGSSGQGGSSNSGASGNGAGGNGDNSSGDGSSSSSSSGGSNGSSSISIGIGTSVNPSLPSSLLPSVLPSRTGFVNFYSVEESYFSAAPSSSLAAHHQRLKQLPLALQSNEQALSAAVTANEPADIGALYLERKRLMAELERMQRDAPPAADILEVRQTMQLPMGFVAVEGKLFFLQSAATAAAAAAAGAESSGAAVDRRLTVAQVHPRGVFKPDPFACGEDGSDAQEFRIGFGGFSGLRGSHILGPEHTSALRRLFDGKRPRLELLYSARRDGGTPAAFHQKCDGRGPTFTVIRCGDERGTIVGGWAGESWNTHNTQYGSRVWLFNFGNKEVPIVCRMDPAHSAGTTSSNLQYGYAFNACMFGSGGQELSVIGSPFKIHSQPGNSFWSAFSFQGRRRERDTKARQTKRRRRTRRRCHAEKKQRVVGWGEGKGGEEGVRKTDGGPGITAHGLFFLIRFVFLFYSLCVSVFSPVLLLVLILRRLFPSVVWAESNRWRRTMPQWKTWKCTRAVHSTSTNTTSRTTQTAATQQQTPRRKGKNNQGRKR